MNETPHAPVVEQVLVAAAFGNQPGSWPLPTAITPHHLWLRAVAAGGQGRYAHAYGDLSVLRRLVPAGPLASLAHSTQGSLLRQLGWHTLARGWDGRALALAGADREAGADALIGLAADALGVGRFAAAGALLDRADPLVVSPLVADRLAVRRRWVAAELAMATGDGATAVRHAEEAVELTQGPWPSRRRATASKATWCWPPRCAVLAPSREHAPSVKRLSMPPPGLGSCRCGGRWHAC